MSSRSPDSGLIFEEIIPLYVLQKKRDIFFSIILRKQQFFVLNVHHYTVTIIPKISHPRFTFQLCQVKFQTIFIFMALTEKQLLTSYKPHKPFLQKRYIDDIFVCVDVWTIPETESNNFIEFAKLFQVTFRFMHELSSEKMFFWILKFLKTQIYRQQNPCLNILQPNGNVHKYRILFTPFLSVKRGFVK